MRACVCGWRPVEGHLRHVQCVHVHVQHMHVPHMCARAHVRTVVLKGSALGGGGAELEETLDVLLVLLPAERLAQGLAVDLGQRRSTADGAGALCRRRGANKGQRLHRLVRRDACVHHLGRRRRQRPAEV